MALARERDTRVDAGVSNPRSHLRDGGGDESSWEDGRQAAAPVCCRSAGNGKDGHGRQGPRPCKPMVPGARHESGMGIWGLLARRDGRWADEGSTGVAARQDLELLVLGGRERMLPLLGFGRHPGLQRAADADYGRAVERVCQHHDGHAHGDESRVLLLVRVRVSGWTEGGMSRQSITHEAAAGGGD